MIIDYIIFYSINVKLITGLIYFSHANIFTNIFRGCRRQYYFRNVTLDIYIYIYIYIYNVFLHVTATMNLYYNLYCAK